MINPADEPSCDVLHVITDTDRRGAQVFANDLDRAMQPMHDVSSEVVALAPGEVGGLDIECLGPERLHPSTLLALRGRIRSADIVIAHGSSTLPACAAASFLTSTPFVTRQISQTSFWVNSRQRRARVRLYLWRARHVVALAPSAANDLRAQLGLRSEKITVIPNGVPGEPFAPATAATRKDARVRFGLDDDRPILLSLGALVPEKGVDMVLRSLSSNNAHLLIVGDGPERAELERLAMQIAPGRVTFAGSIGDPQSAFAAADLLVLASKGGDSMPAVIIEAGFCGLPTVSTDVGAISDTIVSGETGVVVPPGNQSALDDAIGRLVRDAALRAAMGESARRRAQERFEIGVVADQWRKLLLDLVAD